MKNRKIGNAQSDAQANSNPAHTFKTQTQRNIFMPLYSAAIDAAREKACRAITPTWPLDRAIAVNPHWSRVGHKVRHVAARLAILSGMVVFPPRTSFKRFWEEKRITEYDVKCALEEVDGTHALGLTISDCIKALNCPPSVKRLPLLADILESTPKNYNRLPWRTAITHQISQVCAAYFDQKQADWQPVYRKSLYAFWRNTILYDRGINSLMGIPKSCYFPLELPKTRQEVEQLALERLNLPECIWADYLEAVLLTVNGWASWCAYLGWQARLTGNSNENLYDLLAISLAWYNILIGCKTNSAIDHAFLSMRTEWSQIQQKLKQAIQEFTVDEVWQRALELGYQKELFEKLNTKIKLKNNSLSPAQSTEVQAVFCIDVRSEPMRRALERTSSSIQTLGVAGFFGLPIAYTPLATSERRPQVPGLFAPIVETQDLILKASDISFDTRSHKNAEFLRKQYFAREQIWHATSRWPSTAFSFVEAAGIIYLGKLLKWLHPSPSNRTQDDGYGLPTYLYSLCRPAISGLDVSGKILLAAQIINMLGVRNNFAALVLFIGHTSQSENNAQASSLDCGACSGQTGEINARVLVRLLNEPAVIKGLYLNHGIRIPPYTRFVAALHNTTTDEVEGLDIDLLPQCARVHWEKLLPKLKQASDLVRRERAPYLGIKSDLASSALLAEVRRRANDGSLMRPELGLVGNAAFIIAPRHRTNSIVLNGRCFLHDYNADKDKDGSTLELIMTAPMLVTHWINWQYHSSTCDPQHFGSGNKALHNIVGGQIGIFEGSSGDLRIGLSQQSLNNGRDWIHEPLRLTVIIDASREMIEQVIKNHLVVNQLLSNGWLYLWRFGSKHIERYNKGNWFYVKYEC